MITKGKWKVQEFTQGKSKRKIVKVISDYAHICTVDRTESGIAGMPLHSENQKANAQAIASLPDLIEALQATLKCLTTGLCENCSINCPENSNLAIDKAKSALKRAGIEVGR